MSRSRANETRVAGSLASATERDSTTVHHDSTVHDNRWLRVARVVMRVQGAYFLVTGLWPVIDMRSFELITGPKTDDWLVRMVGLLAASIGLTLLIAARGRRPSVEGVVLASTSAISFMAIDVVYVFVGRISEIYLLDALAELFFVLALLVSWLVGTRQARGNYQGGTTRVQEAGCRVQ